MGNAHSAGHQNRLSKPRTNTNSLLVADSPVSQQSQHAHLSLKERHQLKTHFTSPVATEFGSGTSSCDEASIEELAAQLQSRLSNLSRSNSTGSQTGGVRNSISKLTCFSGPSDDPQGVDLDTAIQVFKEVSRNASRDDLAALHQALISAPDSSLLDEFGQVTPSMNRSSSLTRRRSLIETPGLATRNSPKDASRSFKSWKTPQLSAQELQKWQRDRRGPSPPNRFVALHSTDEGRASPVPRAETPGSISHLGALKLGTLVVTNGAPSPAPSTVLSRRKSTADLEEDYFASSPIHASSQSSRQRRAHSVSQTPVGSPNLLTTTGHVATVRPRTSFELSLDIGFLEAHNAHSPGYQDMEPTKRLAVVNEGRNTLASDLQTNHDRPSRTNAPGHVDEGFFELEAHHNHSTSRNVRPAAHKTDSGYSSGGSLRKPNTPGDDGVKPDFARDPSIMAEKIAIGSDAGETDTVYAFEQMVASAQKPSNKRRMPSVRELEISAYDRDSMDLALVSPWTARSSNSQWSVESASSGQSRLQKRRASVQELPVVQACQPIPEGSIPQVPDEVKAKFARRLSQTPEMECLRRTYASTNDVGAEKAVNPQDELPIESPTALPKLPKESKSKEKTQRRRPSMPFFRSKPADDEQVTSHEPVDAVPAIVDFGSVASSLGRSPYDVAMPESHQQQQRRVTSPTHPHQLGSTLPRVRSMVSMDSKTAADFARMRSKDRVTLRPEPLSRTRSFHENGEQTVTVRFGQQAQDSTQNRSQPGQNRVVSFSRPLRPQTNAIPPQRHSSGPATLPQVEEHKIGYNSTPSLSLRDRSTGRGPVASGPVHEYVAYTPQHGLYMDQSHTQTLVSNHPRRRQTWQEDSARQQTAGHPVELPGDLPPGWWQNPENANLNEQYSDGYTEYMNMTGQYSVHGRSSFGGSGSANRGQLHGAAHGMSMQYMQQQQVWR